MWRAKANYVGQLCWISELSALYKQNGSRYNEGWLRKVAEVADYVKDAELQCQVVTVDITVTSHETTMSKGKAIFCGEKYISLQSPTHRVVI